ncbi:MAG: pyridoxamine 5'-phosphate oxidase family protein [Thermoproteota archaeon]|nr:pyridoxamine 5'-phosphate oxidase family protein [Thermoproteota archaeon]
MARNNEESGFKQAVVEFLEAEKRFLKHHEVCRVATSHNDTPLVTPVNFVFDDDGFFYFATDYDTKKYRNLKKNKKSALVVDVYNSSVDNKAVIVQGVVEFVERGEEFQRLYNIFHEKFDWVREEPWKEGEAPFVKVKPLHKVSWGF